MPKNAAEILNKAQRALRTLSERDRIEDYEKTCITEARSLIWGFVSELVSGNDFPFRGALKLVLEETHQNHQYSEEEMVRDAADICETLRQAADNRFRKDRLKILAAQHFLMALREEMRNMN